MGEMELLGSLLSGAVLLNSRTAAEPVPALSTEG